VVLQQESLFKVLSEHKGFIQNLLSLGDVVLLEEVVERQTVENISVCLVDLQCLQPLGLGLLNFNLQFSSVLEDDHSVEKECLGILRVFSLSFLQ